MALHTSIYCAQRRTRLHGRRKFSLLGAKAQYQNKSKLRIPVCATLGCALIGAFATLAPHPCKTQMPCLCASIASFAAHYAIKGHEPNRAKTAVKTALRLIHLPLPVFCRRRLSDRRLSICVKAGGHDDHGRSPFAAAPRQLWWQRLIGEQCVDLG